MGSLAGLEFGLGLLFSYSLGYPCALVNFLYFVKNYKKLRIYFLAVACKVGFNV